MQSLKLKRRLVLFILFLTFIRTAGSADWNCPSSPQTEGTFDVADDCTLSDEVEVSGDLQLTGTIAGGALSIVTAANSRRHFYNPDKGTLTLIKLKLTGGSILHTPAQMATYPNGLGGSIMMYGEKTLTITNCVFESNTARAGGAIFYLLIGWILQQYEPGLTTRSACTSASGCYEGIDFQAGYDYQSSCQAVVDCIKPDGSQTVEPDSNHCGDCTVSASNETDCAGNKGEWRPGSCSDGSENQIDCENPEV